MQISSNRIGIQAIITGALRDGRVVDLVATAQPGIANLIVFDGAEVNTTKQVEDNGAFYFAPKLPEIFRQVILPRVAAPYNTISALLLALVEMLRGSMKLPGRMPLIIAFWVLSTWVPEIFCSPPTLSVAGPEELVLALFRVLRPLCRRAIILTTFSTNLPFEFQLTLMVVDANSPKKSANTWRAGNFRDVYVPTTGGKLTQLICSKAIYTGPVALDEPWTENGFFISVPALADTPSINSLEITELAEALQPQLQFFRLRLLYKLVKQQEKDRPTGIPQYSLSRGLAALVAGDPEAEELLRPILEQQREAKAIGRSVDIQAVIVETLLNAAHQQQKSLAVSKLCERANTILRARGETLEFNSREIGWKLNDLDVPRERQRNGRAIEFSQPVRKQIHELAQQFGFELSARGKDCEECAAMEWADV